MALENSINVLKENLSELPAKDLEFAKSLIKQFDRKKTLSDKQALWVDRLIEASLTHTPAAAQITMIAPMTKVYEWFENAKGAKLKNPTITFEMDTGAVIRIKQTRAGKRPGTIVLTNGRPYGQSLFYGYVSTEGHWENTAAAEPVKDEIKTFLTQVSEDPLGFLKNYGCKTGNCCFCNSGLTAGISTELGYGPTCAKRWGLPWGKTAVAEDKQGNLL